MLRTHLHQNEQYIEEKKLADKHGEFNQLYTLMDFLAINFERYQEITIGNEIKLTLLL